MKHKWFALTLTSMTAALALASGTFAWQSISQRAKNEKVKTVNPGARLHDDFDGENKDIYVENFMDPEQGDVVFARIRLREYLETGKEAGMGTGNAIPAVTGTAFDDTSTWPVHDAYNANEIFHKYFSWTEGGSTTYMPTFNLDTTSLDSDINGTLAGGISGIPYGDYIDYSKNPTAEGTEYYADHVTIAKQTHTADTTQDAVVMTMNAWKNSGYKKGPYWVYDTDGWAYWADAIEPGTATGCLLNEVKYIGGITFDYYYAIDVEGQFVSADEWGIEADGSDAYFAMKDGQKESASKDALILLEIAAGTQKKLTITEASGEVLADPGDSLTFDMEVTLGKIPMEHGTVTWQVSGNTVSDTQINSDGKLTIGANEIASILTITARTKSGGETVEGTYTLHLNVPKYEIEITALDNMGEKTGEKDYAVLGRSRRFSGITTKDGIVDSGLSVKWSISSAVNANGVSVSLKSGTAIDNTGVLTVDASETAAKLTILATSTLNSSITESYEVDLLIEMEYIPYIEIGSTNKASIDGYHWYVLAQDGDKYLLWTQENITDNSVKYPMGVSKLDAYKTYGDYRCSIWNQYYTLNYKTLFPTLSQKTIPTTLTSYNWSTNVPVSYTAYAFLLSEADYLGTDILTNAAPSTYYTYNGQKIVSSAIMQDTGLDYVWTRTYHASSKWGCMNYGSGTCETWDCSSDVGPTGCPAAWGQLAMWVQL